jgi:spermidine/putrescine ABC transporter ATP-binding subunit
MRAWPISGGCGSATPRPRVVMIETPPAISLRGVTKRYGNQVALTPISLDIGEGEFFCLLGPSGCGKTTTLNLIGGFIAPSAGEISIRGQRVDRLPPHRRRVNTVFQSYALFPHMTVRDNIGFGLRMARVPKAESAGRIEEALDLVGLETYGDRLPTQLSGGQQQRVAVARALVNRPAVLLLDEPLGALDLKLRKRLQIELSLIHRDVGTTFVYVTHDQEEAMSMATRIAVLDEGRIEQIGTPSEIYNHPNSRFVADFIGESNFMEVDLGRAGDRVVHLVDGRPVPGNVNGEPPFGRATLMIRPESIHVSAGSDAPPTSLRGRVVQTSFLGSLTRVAVGCDPVPVPITASLFGRERLAARTLTPDTEVSLWWDPDDAVLLTETQSQEVE